MGVGLSRAPDESSRQPVYTRRLDSFGTGAVDAACRDAVDVVGSV
jgi:hypothetical protein